MINAYRFSGTAVSLSTATPLEKLPDDIVWIDLIDPDKAEETYVETLLGIEVPTREDLKDIEPSSRLFTEDGSVFMTASLLWKAESELPTLTDVGFVLTGNRMVTVRYGDPKSFGLFISALKRSPERCSSGPIVLTRLMETIVDRTAEILEQTVLRIDTLSLQVFGDRSRNKRRAPHYLEDRLMDVAGYHRLVGKTRDSLMSLSRMMTFLYTVPSIQEDQQTRELCRSVSRDIQSLSEHVSFVSGNITFLLDASLGLISVEQNAIIKIFSIASVVFLPPTLVASLYGMNFQFMPELGWHYGYPLALAGMLISAVIPFFFFRWKGWL